MDFVALILSVEREIETSRYPNADGAVGNSWSPERVEAGLATMRSALCDPYRVGVELRDTIQQIDAEEAAIRRRVAVADDGLGMLLAFDPGEGEFILAQKAAAALSQSGSQSGFQSGFVETRWAAFWPIDTWLLPKCPELRRR